MFFGDTASWADGPGITGRYRGMHVFWDVLLNGIYVGGIYIAISVGLSMVWGVMKIVNFAHGSMLMVAMYSTYWLTTLLDLNPYLATIAVVPFLFVLGYAIQAVFLNPLFKKERTEVIEPISLFIFTCGLMWFLDNLSLLLFKADFRTIYGKDGLASLGAGLSSVLSPRLLLFAASLAMVAVLHLLSTRLDFGKAIRATSQDRYAASLQGIEIYRVYSLTFAIGAATLGVAGSFLLPFYPVFPTVGLNFLIKSFIIVVLGGIGSIWGVVIAGLILGIAESAVTQLITGAAGLIVSYILFVGILLCKPLGLLGKES
jgi:branched-chain amino acid transport system permease protein